MHNRNKYCTWRTLTTHRDSLEPGKCAQWMDGRGAILRGLALSSDASEAWRMQMDWQWSAWVCSVWEERRDTGCSRSDIKITWLADLGCSFPTCTAPSSCRSCPGRVRTTGRALSPRSLHTSVLPRSLPRRCTVSRTVFIPPSNPFLCV